MIYSYEVRANDWGIGRPVKTEYAKGKVKADSLDEAERLAIAGAIKKLSKLKLKGSDFTQWGYTEYWPSDEHGGGWVEDATDDAEWREVEILECDTSPVHVVLEHLGYKPLFNLPKIVAA